MNQRVGEPGDGAGRDHRMDASQAAPNGRATVTVDREGIIHQWGDAVTDVVGHSADDALGRSLNVVIPPVLRPLHWWGFDHAMKSGRLNREIFTVPALRKDGRIVVAHATIDLIPAESRGADGAVVTFVGVGAPWRGRAWQAALAPINFAHRVWRRARTR
jgi:PAS domain S-box-containing protein